MAARIAIDSMANPDEKLNLYFEAVAQIV